MTPAFFIRRPVFAWVIALGILLGGLLASGEITDERELRFLAERLKSMENAEKPSLPTIK